jgi:hypothetical protein
MKLLVLTTEPVSADQLRAAAGEGIDPADSEVMIVAPALHESALRFWFSDADEAIARAERVRRESVEKLGAEGVSASADTGEGDPLDAVIDALQTFKADRIVIFSHPEGEQLYREGIDDTELEERFGIPVQRAELAPGSSP